MDKGGYNDQTQEGKLAKKIKNFIYHPTDVIGSGFSSQVYKGVNQLQNDPDHRVIAIKVIELSKVQNQVEKYLFNNQVNALKSIKHPNILNTVDILMTKNNVYLVTEYCEGGDLLKHIKKQGNFTELQALKIIRDVVCGYMCVEQNKIIHRDLKTANIFLKRGIAKIADFGFCEFIGQKKPQIAYNVGSPAYMSPQSYKENHYSAKSDIWGIGIILYEILVGQTPDKNLTYTEMATNLMNSKISNIKSEEIRRILALCFKKNLNERITAKNLLQLIKAEISSMQNLQHKKNMNPQRGPIITKTPIMMSAVNIPAPGHHRDNRMYSPTKNKQIKFHRTEAQRGSQLSQQNMNQDSRNKIQNNVQPNNYQYLQLKDQTEMLLFLYRLLKFSGTEGSAQKITQIHLILFRHRNFVDSLVDNLQLTAENDEQYQQFKYLRSRFDEVYLQISKESHISNAHGYRDKLQKYANCSFLETDALDLYRLLIRQACNQCILIFESKPESVNWNQLGVILDYLMIQYQILGLHADGLAFNQIIKITKLDGIIRQQPKKVTQAHLQLLKYKFNRFIWQSAHQGSTNRQSQQAVSPFVTKMHDNFGHGTNNGGNQNRNRMMVQPRANTHMYS